MSVITGTAKAIYSAKEQKKASQVAADAQMQAADTIYKQFQETKKMLDPFVQTGTKANEVYASASGALGKDAQRQAYDNYVESPGVAWAREQGLKGLDSSMAASGQLVSGARDKGRIEYSQGVATQGFDQYMNRLSNVTNVGLVAAQAVGGIGGQAAMGQAGGQSNAGLELAQGRIARARTYTSALSNIENSIGGLFMPGMGSAAGAGATSLWSQPVQTAPVRQPQYNSFMPYIRS